MIEITSKDSNSQARTGILHLPQGPVETPVFMPVGTSATVKAILQKDLSDMGYQLILGNTYHLYLRPGVDVIEHAGGLHPFSGWEGNYLTDSGGFQVFSLSGMRKISDEGVKFQSHIDGSYHMFTPESVAIAQSRMNSDIQMVLDVCTAPGISHNEALKALSTTTHWAQRAKQQWQQEQDKGYKGLLFGIIQGNFFKDLRQQSAEEILSLDLPGIAIGGLSVGETPEIFKEYLIHTAQFLPETKPRYVMGIGTPDYMLEAVEAGIDMFDCVYPTRVARNSSCFTKNGMVSLKKEDFKFDQNPIDSHCSCFVCQKYSRSYVRHLFKAGEILGPMLTTYHNLFFLANFMKQIRSSIKDGTFLDFKRNYFETFYQDKN